MAEQEGTVIPGESTEQHANPGVAADREVAYEVKAKELGWRPESEWDGEPSDWVPAKEFVGRQKLYDRIHSLKGELVNQGRKFEQDMNAIKQYVQQMSEIEYKRAVADLTAQRKEAVREADVEAVERINQEIDELKDARKAAPLPAANATTQYSQAFIQWTERNSWYKNDSELRDEADSLGVAYALKHKGTKTEQEVMDYVEKQIKKMNPDKFQSKETTKAPSVEGASAGNSATNKSGAKLSVRDLTEDEARVMKTLVARKIVTQEKYLADLAEAKAR
jgi:hypothetical protein